MQPRANDGAGGMPRKKMSDEEIAENREAIRKVATSLFSRYGYEAVTMRSIAKELGWSPMATYKYFENKDAIFTAVREEALLRLAQTMQRSALDAKDPLEKLYLQCRAYVRFGLENRHEYSLAFEYYSTEMPGFPLMTSNSLMSWELQAEVLEEACRQNRLKGDPLLINHLLWIALHGIVMLQNGNRFIFGKTAEDLTEEAINATLHKFLP